MCGADKAIDSKMFTKARTDDSGTSSWWAVEFKYLTKIEKIFLFTEKIDVQRGYFKKLTVETKRNSGGDWEICKGEYSVTEPVSPHVIQCERPTTAKYLKFRIPPYYLVLNEVEVTGDVMGMSRYFFAHPTGPVPGGDISLVLSNGRQNPDETVLACKSEAPYEHPTSF